MKTLIAVASDALGRRYEIELRLPDDVGDVLHTDDADSRLQGMLQKSAERAAVVGFVTHKDHEERKAAPPRKRAANAGPNQIAFAGTDEVVHVDAKGQEIARLRGGKPVKASATQRKG